MKNTANYIPIEKIRENTIPIPLCHFEEVKRSIIEHVKEKAEHPLREGKKPFGKWKKEISYPHPSNLHQYKGWNDTERGSAIMGQKVIIDEKDYYLAIIDLDNKPSQEVPIEILKEVFQDLIDSSYTVKSPGGGYHIYILSKKPTKRKQPPKKAGIDYQITNYSKDNTRGRYALHNFKIDLIYNGKSITGDELVKNLKKDPEFKKKNTKIECLSYLGKKLSGVKKEYKKINAKEVLIVDDADCIIDEKLLEIQNKGYLLKNNLEIGIITSIVDLLNSYVIEGVRQDLALGLSGFLRKNDFSLEDTKIIFQKLFKEDEELQNRLFVADSTFEKDLNEIAGHEILKNILSNEDLVKLYDIINPLNDIDSDLQNHFYRCSGKFGREFALPKDRLSIMMIQSLENDGYILVKDSHNMKTYVYHDDTGYIPVTPKWVTEFFNKKFSGVVGYEDCKKVLKQVNKFVEKNYNLIEFSNGVLNTETLDFKEDTKCKESLPKMKLDYRWNPKAKGGKLEDFMKKITSTDKKGFENNYETLKLAVGNSFMAINQEHLLIALIGRPNTGKTTFIDYVVKVIFKYSEVSLKAIVTRDRFAYYPLFNVDVNIDNDTSSCELDNIGSLNTVIEGNVPDSEEKGVNERLRMPKGVGPKTWITGNKLPKIYGAGFERRLCLIWIDNVPFDTSFFDEEITDEEFEWLTYTSISSLHKLYSTGEKIVTPKDSKIMNNIWKKNSKAIDLAIEHIFEFDVDGQVRTSEAISLIKEFVTIARKKGEIFKESGKIGSKSVKKAMDENGYGYDKISGYPYYLNCRIREDWRLKIDEIL